MSNAYLRLARIIELHMPSEICMRLFSVNLTLILQLVLWYLLCVIHFTYLFNVI